MADLTEDLAGLTDAIVRPLIDEPDALDITAAETEDGNIANLVASIKEKDEKIAELRGIINNAKNKRVCPECSAIIDRNSNYCNVCGADLNAVKSEEEKPENGAEESTEK